MKGKFNEYGGQYVPEILMGALEELEREYEKAKNDKSFKDELNKLRIYVLEEEKLNKGHIELILASYKFRLVQLCQAYLKQGYMTSEQYEQLMEFYKVYSGMGGNGQGKEYFEKAIKLPIENNN